MKEALKDWITDIMAILIWIGASYKEFFTDDPFGIWLYLAIMGLGIIMLGLNIKQIAKITRGVVVKLINKKLG